MIRPFLLLVAMPPIMRNQVGNLLGISLLSEAFFGDPHAEALEIVKGMQRHSATFFEVINPVGSNWFDVVRRMIDKILLRGQIVKCEDWWKSLEECIKPNSKLVSLVEKEFLLKLSDFCEHRKMYKEPANLSEEALENRDAVGRFILKKITSLGSEKILNYYIFVLDFYSTHNLNLYEDKSFEEVKEEGRGTAIPPKASVMSVYQAKLMQVLPKFKSGESPVDGLLVSQTPDCMWLFYVVILLLNVCISTHLLF